MSERKPRPLRRAEIEMMMIRTPAYNCVHPHLTWGFDPGIVTCTCGARWRARIVGKDEPER